MGLRRWKVSFVQHCLFSVIPAAPVQRETSAPLRGSFSVRSASSANDENDVRRSEA